MFHLKLKFINILIALPEFSYACKQHQITIYLEIEESILESDSHYNYDAWLPNGF